MAGDNISLIKLQWESCECGPRDSMFYDFSKKINKIPDIYMKTFNNFFLVKILQAKEN